VEPGFLGYGVTHGSINVLKIDLMVSYMVKLQGL
jgi:hypothetical protein